MTSQTIQPESSTDPLDTARQIANTLTRAFWDAGVAGHRAKPALRAKQGSRTTYMLSLPIGELLEMMTVGPGGESDEDSANRGITEDWVRSIERGLRRKLAGGPDNSKYVLFPFTANIPENGAVFRPLYNEPGGLSDMGILTMPRSRFPAWPLVRAWQATVPNPH